MRTLFNNNRIAHELVQNSAKLSIIPLMFFVPVFVFQIELESLYDYLLEVTRLFSVVIIASLYKNLINSRVISFGIKLAIINGVYDAITEIVYVDHVISNRFPFADALLDEGLLLIAYGCLIMGLYKHLSKVNRLSLLDDLTKCYTRSALCLIPQGKYQLFYMDLDKFKSINDTKGHNVGDRILSVFGRRLIRCCDNIGYAFRVGGDEFIAIVDIGHAQTFIDLFTKACNLESIEFSYGTAACSDKNFDHAIAEADENLYEMKQFKAASLAYDFEV